MKLYEFQGKTLLRKYGIATPEGLLGKRDSVMIWNGPAVLKAQVLSGGRGKAGAVVALDGKGGDAALDAALEKLFGMTVKGESVNTVLIEERIPILHERYVAITFDGEAGTPLMVVAPSGGMDIEETAIERPELILKLPFNSILGPLDHHLRKAAAFAGTSHPKEFSELLSRLYKLYCETNALLVEINPLAETTKNSKGSHFVALDAKIELDDDAEPAESVLSVVTWGDNSDTITYVPLDGDIGLISDGAGTGMLALDLLQDRGGRAADFCEMGGTTSPKVIYSAMDRVMSGSELRSLLIVLIGGFNRMDEMAEGIVGFVADRAPKIPVVVRLCGTMEEEGRKIMKDANLPVYDDLEAAVAAAVTGEKPAGSN
jgi:succinyl-CoA synthetase beta subunit